MAILFAFLLDAPVEHLSDIQGNAFLGGLAHIMSRLGEGWVVAVAGIVAPAVLLLLGRTQAARVIFLIAVVGLLTGAAATLLRSVIGRTRPNAHTAQGVYGIRHDSHWIIGKYEFGSFPSGHAATVIGVAAAAWMLHRRLGIVAAGYALLVSWSRIAQHNHHFSDVIGSAILGTWGAYWLLTRAGPWFNSLERSVHGAFLRSRGTIRDNQTGFVQRGLGRDRAGVN